MQKQIRQISHWFARITGWKWLALMTGIALLAACSGKSDKSTGGKDSVRDTERVTCYEPVAIDQNQSDTIGNVTEE